MCVETDMTVNPKCWVCIVHILNYLNDVPDKCSNKNKGEDNS